MKTIELSSEIGTGLKELLVQADQESLLLKTPDGREFVLAEIDDLDRELEQVRNNPELMKFLSERSQGNETIGLSQVRKQLGI